MENNDAWDEIWNSPDPKSGLICEVCGYDDSLKCSTDFTEEEATEILCGQHAAEQGYCCCCGIFCAGSTSFDFVHPGYCDNCYIEVSQEDEDEDDTDCNDNFLIWQMIL